MLVIPSQSCYLHSVTADDPGQTQWLAQLAPVYRGELPPLLANLTRSLNSPASRRAYLQGLRHFAAWAAREPDGPGLSRESVLRYRAWMMTPNPYGKAAYSSATVNLRLAALRALAREAVESGVLPAATAFGISSIKGVKMRGARLGQWLPAPQMQEVIALPDVATLRGKRDRALLMVLFGGGLRRSELTGLGINHIQHRQGRWGLVDIVGKGGRMRSVPLPGPAKHALDDWLTAANIRLGPVFRAITRHGKIAEEPLTGEAVLQILEQYGQTAGVSGLRPHDTRRTFAQLCRALPDAKLEDIQELLGHESLETTRRYLLHGEAFSRSVNDAIFDV